MQLTTDDRMAGLEAPDGRSFRPDGDGVIHLPDELADYGRRAARLAPMFHVRRPIFGGFDAAELRRRYTEWQDRRADAANTGGEQGGTAGREE